MRKRGGLAIDEAELAVYAQLLDRNAHQFTARNFILDADFRQEGDAIAHRYEALDGLQRR